MSEAKKQLKRFLENAVKEAKKPKTVHEKRQDLYKRMRQQKDEEKERYGL